MRNVSWVQAVLGGLSLLGFVGLSGCGSEADSSALSAGLSAEDSNSAHASTVSEAVPTARDSSSSAALVVAPALPVAIPPACAKDADFPETGELGFHVEEDNVTLGRLGLSGLRAAGEHLFIAKFNTCDGAGRPATTGGGLKRTPTQPAFTRISSPEANSCAGCHAQPFAGGSGEFVANVFVLAQRLDPITLSASSDFSDERNTIGMHGSGAIEMLAREMTVELQAQAAPLADGNHVLTVKGVKFAISKANGAVVQSEGVNLDLVIRPFFSSGTSVSLRQFTIDAFNHHLGMQAEERFDLNPDRGFESDFDEDGVHRELSIGDVTATTVFQAALPVPQQVTPSDRAAQAQVRRGEQLFGSIGCADCHKPALELKSPFFSEPNPFNPPGTWRDTTKSFRWDMTREGGSPRLRRGRDGSIPVKAYTDLKRHDLCDDPASVVDPVRFFCNEKLAQDRPNQDGKSGTEFFITRKLWDVGSSAPYGHRGDITTINEAILYHGGEGRAARDAFRTLALNDRRAVVNFLKTLQVVQDSSDDR